MMSEFFGSSATTLRRGSFDGPPAPASTTGSSCSKSAVRAEPLGSCEVSPPELRKTPALPDAARGAPNGEFPESPLADVLASVTGLDRGETSEPAAEVDFIASANILYR